MMKKLEKTTKKNPFRVPDGYFEEVNSKIISATSGISHTDRRFVFSSRIRPYLLTAASVAGFILLGYAAIRIIESRRSEPLVTAIVNDDQFAPFLNDLDIYSLEENAATLPMPDEGPDVSKGEIIDYLILENIEISEIYEQL